MQARMENPALTIPGALAALQALSAAASKAALAETTVKLVHLRASQINGCSVCVDMHARELRKHDESDERLFAVAAWRDAPYFTAAERAALALTESVTRLSDRSDPVPDDVWQETARHFEPAALSALVLQISTINLWNRLNVAVRKVAGGKFR